jgi:hypothetical protein
MSRVLVLIQHFTAGKGDPAVQVASFPASLPAAMAQPWPPDCCYRRITDIPGMHALDGILPGDAIWEQRGPQEPWTAVPARPAGGSTARPAGGSTAPPGVG